MKAITLREPWATLVSIQAKRIETRSWPAPDWLIGQRIAIHAAKGLTAAELAMLDEEPFEEALAAAGIAPYPHGGWCGPVSQAFAATRGKVLCTAVLDGCFRFDRQAWRTVDANEAAFGDFSPGRFGWRLRDVRPLPSPIPATGALGLWDWQEGRR